MSLFDLVADFLQPIADLFPRIEPRPCSAEWLVVDGVLGTYSTSKPVVYVPTLTHVERWPRLEHDVDLGLQRVMSANLEPLAVNGTVIIQVTDPLLLRSRVSYDRWEHTVSQLIRGEVTAVITGLTVEEAVEDGRDAIWAACEELLSEYGIEIVAVTLEDFISCLPVTVLS